MYPAAQTHDIIVFFRVLTRLDIFQGQALFRGVKQMLTRAGTGKKTDQQKRNKNY